MTQIFIGSDHAGFNLKNKIKKYLEESKISFSDEGTYTKDSCDYPFYAKEVANLVVKNKSKGILICGTGIGMSIAANKVKGVRAALVTNESQAILAKSHNDANILCLAGNTPITKAKVMIESWLKTKTSKADRHVRRREGLE